MCWARWTTPRTAHLCAYRASASTSPSANSPKRRCGKPSSCRDKKRRSWKPFWPRSRPQSLLQKTRTALKWRAIVRPMIFCVLLRIRIFQSRLRPNGRQKTTKCSQTAVSCLLTKCRYSARQPGRSAIFAEELEIRFAEGDIKFALSNALPLFDDTGKVRGAVGAFADITNLKRTEIALRESEERLKFALEAAAPEPGRYAGNRGIQGIGPASSLRRDPGTPMTHDEALARVHPEDRSRLKDALRHTLETGKPFSRNGACRSGRVGPVGGSARGTAICFRKAGC